MFCGMIVCFGDTFVAELAKERLILALDVETIKDARTLIQALRGDVEMFKVGSQLFTAAGPDIVREIVRSGARVFLDLKFHDIPNTVAAAAVEATRLGVSLFDVHAAGGREMMRRTAEAVSEAAEKEGLTRPSVIAVTVLTSAHAETLKETGVHAEVLEHVKALARLAAASGLDGVVASPHEVREIRSCVSQKGFLIVTPGVRPSSSDHQDQKRVMTPAEAVRAGADYLVLGRAITVAPDPVRATHAILEEMQAALDEEQSATHR